MPYSYNGFQASPDRDALGIRDYTLPGTSVTFPQGIAYWAAPLLLWAVGEWHRRIEPVRPGTCWGFYYRETTGGSSLSNHASGTAVDVNAPQHPYNRTGTFTATQRRTLAAIVAEANRDAKVLTSGEFYRSNVDGMHLEVATGATKAQVIAAGKRLTQRDWFDMATKADLAAVVEAKLRELEPYIHRVVQEAVQAELGNEGALVAKQTWGYQLPDPNSTTTPPKTYAAGSWLRGRDSALKKAGDRIIAALKH